MQGGRRMNFVRQSKFRHVFCKPLKVEYCLSDVRVSEVSCDSTFAACNPKFIAVIVRGSGGPFMVLPLGKQGRVEKDHPLVDAHRAPVLELAWNPFDDQVIASASEDTTVKVWRIPEGGLRRTLKEPIAELLGHQKRVTTLQWHPTANNVLLTAAADLRIYLWNVGSSEALIEIAGHPDLVWGVGFNRQGSKIVTTCKDKLIRIIDPRSGKILAQGQGHEGMKPQKAVYCRDGRIFTTGFTKRSERLYALREEADLGSPIVQEELDTSNGLLFPFYDPDTGLVFLSGKGDNNIRYFEINNEAPYVHYINIYTSSEPQKGVAFMPKRGMKVLENETARIYKCTNKGLVEVLQFYVPRKSDQFQEDLYPDTAAPIPALTAEEWISGKDSEPRTMSLAPTGTVRPGPVMSGLVGSMGGPSSTSFGNSDAQPSAPPQASQPPPQPQAQPQASPVAKKSNILAKIPVSPQPSEGSVESGSRGRWGGGEEEESPAAGLSRKSKAEAALAELRERNARPRSPPPQRKLSDYTEASNAAYSAHSLRSPQPPTPQLSPASHGGSHSQLQRPPSVSSVAGSLGGQSLEDLVSDVAKLKAVLRRHEKRIRYLEEQLADRDMDGLE